MTSAVLRYTPLGWVYRFFYRRRKRVAAVAVVFLAGLAWKFARSNPWWAVGGVVFVLLWSATRNGVLSLFLVAVVVGGVRWARLAADARASGKTISQVRADRRKVAGLREQWALACQQRGLLGRGKTVPGLYDVRVVGKDVTARLASGKIGLSPARIRREAEEIAAIVRCREVVVTDTSPGCALVEFQWTDPLSRTVRPRDLVSAPKGHVPFGLDAHGEVVSLPVLNGDGETVFTPTLLAGVSGSGKSSALWALLAGFIVQGIPVRLRVVDPAGGVEFAALAEALDEQGRGLLRVHRYESDPSQAGKVIDVMHAAMRARLNAMTGATRLHRPTLAEPLDILLVDELLLLAPILRKGTDSNLARIMTIGRKAGFSVMACTQLSEKNEIGPVRDLFLRRLVFATETREQTAMALGSPSRAEGAPAHLIGLSTPGVGYMYGGAQVVKFRAAFFTDPQVQQIAHGHVPYGMEDFGRRAGVPHALYRLCNSDRELLYVGITNNLERRMREHAADKAWWGEVDMAASPRPQMFDSQEAARQAEAEAIRAEFPRYNEAANRANVYNLARWRRRTAA